MRLTQTNDVDELANSINNINICGDADLLTAIKIAQLSLKHRKNKSQRQRIVVFVGHPLRGSEDDFEDVGLRLKKNNVSIDVINFSNPDNVSRLQTLVNTANKESDDAPTCHFLDVPAGCSSIMEVMIASPILQPEDMGGAAGDMGEVLQAWVEAAALALTQAWIQNLLRPLDSPWKRLMLPKLKLSQHSQNHLLSNQLQLCSLVSLLPTTMTACMMMIPKMMMKRPSKRLLLSP